MNHSAVSSLCSIICIRIFFSDHIMAVIGDFVAEEANELWIPASDDTPRKTMKLPERVEEYVGNSLC